MSDKPTKTANYEATKLSASELADWLTGFANQNEGGLVDYEHANMLEIARRLDALRWRDAGEVLPETGQRVIARYEGVYDEMLLADECDTKANDLIDVIEALNRVEERFVTPRRSAIATSPRRDLGSDGSTQGFGFA